MSELALKLIKEAKEKRLTRLDLGNCGLTELPDELFELVWLEELILSNHWYIFDYYSVKSSKNKLSSIEEITKNQNSIKNISEKISNLKNLKIFICGGAYPLDGGDLNIVWKLESIEALKSLVNLEYLDICFTEISNIAFIQNLKNLIYLNLDTNKIEDISPISNLKNLKYLLISRNQVIDFSSLLNLTNLSFLGLAKNNCTDFSFLEAHINLETFFLSNLKKKDLHFFNKLRNLNHLELSNSEEIVDLDFLVNLTNLEILELDDNKNLKNISSIKELTKLRSLSLNSTSIEDLSPIVNLSNIDNLSLMGTKINSLNSIRNLIKLEYLYASYTQIDDLEPLKDLINLKHIDLTSTKVKELCFLENLNNLQKIILSNTQVSDLSPLKNYIKSGIQIIIWETDFLPINAIVVENCPISNPPRHIVEQGNEAIIRYWQELENKETITNNQTKLIFIGNSRAGKTSLWQLLKDKIYNEQADSTHGIKTEIWDTEPLGTEDNQNLAAHIWDFGGQEYYHATHRLFLADNAIYVLVWEKVSNQPGTRLEKFKLDDDPKAEIEEVELEHFPASYWLENIQYFAGKHCPVLIVQNKVDEEVLKANYTEGVQEVNDCFHLSVQNAFGFQEGNVMLKRHDLRFQDFKERLLELLRKNATAFKLVKYYAQVREALEAKAKDTEYIAVSELKDIALQFDETPDLENLLAYLKSFTNTVLYFPQNDVLKDRLYLNPTHISRDIYKILNKQVRENNGKFDLAHIKIRLSLNDDQEAERFAALMREFDLIFEKTKTIKGETKRQFIIPQYLPKKEDLSEDMQFLIEGYSLETAFTIQFKSFVPRSLMLRFIAANGALSNQETYWRNGIIYKSPTTPSMIKVEYDHDQSTFTIQVQDKQKQTIDMQNIVEQFVKLENSDEHIKISNNGKLYVDLRTIRKLQHENRREDIYTDGNIVSLKEYNWLITKQKTDLSMAITLEELKVKVGGLIGNDKLKEAIELIATWGFENSQKQLQEDLPHIKRNLTDLNKQHTLGLLSFQEVSREKTRLSVSIFDLLNRIEVNENDELTTMENNSTKELDWEIEILKYLVSNKEKRGTTNEFASLNALKIHDVNSIVKFLIKKNFIEELGTIEKFGLHIKATYEAIKFLENTNHINIKNTPKQDNPKIYFSYAWGDDDETGESREKIVQELYESLKMDGYNVVRDKEDVGYKGSISDFMKTIGKGNSIIVAISDKYLKSENCMFEMYEIFRNAKLEKEGFIEKIYPIRIESIRLSDPLVLDTYFEHWEKKEKDWEQLIVKRGTRISSEQQEQYRRIKAIAHELGDFLAFLNDINAKTKADLSKNNFEEIKKAITKHVIF